MGHKSVIVSGATCQVGYFLLPRLIEAGFRIHALSRRDPAFTKTAHPLISWHQMDISLGWKELSIQGVSHFIHLAPLWLLPDMIDDLSHLGIRRIVALSSTSRFTKINSRNFQEQETVNKFVTAEQRVIEKCAVSMVTWTLLRPTLIYGCGMDRNVTMIARFIKSFGFFPLVSAGRGDRQPVHADDVAAACLAVLNCPVAFNRDYNLSGGQTLTFREMVEAVFLALDMKPRIVVVPRILMFPLIKLAACTKTYGHINKEMLQRVDHDMCFDSSDAQHDFGYSPRKFHYQDRVRPEFT
jgi:nucleoside-diphosphate-sugar epimerase